MVNPNEAVDVLMSHYGMTGHPKPVVLPRRAPFENAFGAALAAMDTPGFEMLCATLVFNRWDPYRLIVATPEHSRPRLRVAAAIGLFLIDFSTQGLPWASETQQALRTLVQELRGYSLADDPWDRFGPYAIETEFFKPYGLSSYWPLSDFLKQYTWARSRNRARVRKLILQEALFRRYQQELEAINRLPERRQLLEQILDEQGESPRDRAWPTEGGNEPEPPPGWDPSGSHHYKTVHRLYVEQAQAGKLPAPASLVSCA
jgi:hypothetical protein